MGRCYFLLHLNIYYLFHEILSDRVLNFVIGNSGEWSYRSRSVQCDVIDWSIKLPIFYWICTSYHGGERNVANIFQVFRIFVNLFRDHLGEWNNKIRETSKIFAILQEANRAITWLSLALIPYSTLLRRKLCIKNNFQHPAKPSSSF